MWFWKSRTEVKLDRILEIQSAILKNQYRLSRNQCVLDKQSKRITKLIRALCGNDLKKLSIEVTGERSVDGMADIIEFMVNLPEKSAPDVVSRELTVVMNGDVANQVVFTLDADATVVEGLEGPQDAEVIASLVDIDDSGNKSDASVVTAILTDSIAPPKPGVMGVVVVGESHVDDTPAVDDVVEPVEPVDPVDPVDGAAGE